MMSAVEAIQDANKEIHSQPDLADVLPGTTMGGPEPPPPPLPPPPLHLAPSIHHQHLHQQQQQQQQQQHGSSHHPHHQSQHQDHGQQQGTSRHEQLSPHQQHQQQHQQHQQQQQQRQQQSMELEHQQRPHQSQPHLDLDRHQPQSLQPSQSPRPLQLPSQGVSPSQMHSQGVGSPNLHSQGLRSSPSLHSQSISSPQLHSPHLQSQGVGTADDGERKMDMDIASSSQRSHICLTCLKGFRSKQQLAQHTLVHSNIRKYTCTYCERAFKQLSHLQQHTRIHTEKARDPSSPVSSEDRRYTCTYCQRAFKQLTHLIQHTRLHTGEKPYQCKFEGCDRAFAQLSNLQHHMRNHEDQVKKEASRIHKCQVCHRSYTNESSLKAHTLKMHVHINKGPLEGVGTTEGTLKKRKKKKKSQMYASPTMVPLSSHDGRSGLGKKTSSESSDEDDLIIIGENKKGEGDNVGGMPRSLVESLNHYERTLQAAGVMGGGGGKKLQDSNISSSNQFSGASGLGNGNRNNRFDPGRAGSLGLQGLMGLPGVDPALMSSQHPDMIERAAAAAAAAVSNQLHSLNHNPNISSGMLGGQNQQHGQMLGKGTASSTDTNTTTSRAQTPNPTLLPLDMMGMGGGQYGGQNPYLSSHIMDAHLRSQLTPMSLPVVPEQYPAHSGPPLGGSLSHHARYLGPRGMSDLSMSYGQQIPSSQSLLTSSASGSHQLTPPGIHHGGSRPPSVMSSPQHVPESLNFNT